VPEIYLPTHRIDPAILAKWAITNHLWWYLTYSLAWTAATGYGIKLAAGLIPVEVPNWVWVVWFVALTPLMLLSIKDNLTRSYRKKTTSQFQVNRTMKLDDEGFEVTYQNGVFSRIPWTVVLKAKWTRDFLILQTTLGNPFPIPVSILTPEAKFLIEEAISRPKPEILPTNVV
jgi:hypothetical protein